MMLYICMHSNEKHVLFHLSRLDLHSSEKHVFFDLSGLDFRTDDAAVTFPPLTTSYMYHATSSADHDSVILPQITGIIYVHFR